MHRDPYFTELESPEARRIEAALHELDADWLSSFGEIHETWLCGPKSFRSLERILWAIGKQHPVSREEPVPSFLGCHDTAPDPGDARAWWGEFLAALEAWWQERPAHGSVAEQISTRLGSSSPLKRWLVRLYARRLRMLEESGNIGKLVRAST